jgi:hypothetical protein
MKFIVTTIITIAFALQLKAQELDKHFDFIISIDERIPTGSLSDFKIIAQLENGEEKIIRARYHPGDITISNGDHSLLMSEKAQNVFLSFYYTEWIEGDERKDYRYKLDLKKGWLTSYFYILYIFNTDKPKYKKMFKPIEGEIFTYEFDSPNGSMRRVTKMKRAN